MTSLTLVSHHLCPYVQRAAITLTETGVPFERIYVDLSNKPDWFVALSPLGKVPLLRVGADEREAVLFESNVICEYIEETQPGPKLHPGDPLERALHRGWMEFGSATGRPVGLRDRNGQRHLRGQTAGVVCADGLAPQRKDRRAVVAYEPAERERRHQTPKAAVPTATAPSAPASAPRAGGRITSSRASRW